MKRILLMLALCGFIGTPALAQEAGPEREKTPEELLKELHWLGSRNPYLALMMPHRQSAASA